jgi:hypothetical protein
MLGQFLFIVLLISSLSPHLLIPRRSFAQLMDSITSEHVRMRLPVEREALGRDIILDLERCYEYMGGATDANLPRRILVIVDWSQPAASCNYREASITIGMDQPAAALDSKEFLMYQAARQIAHLGLLELSRGAEREDNRFMFEGMMEILAREYTRRAAGLEAAWVLSRLLDEMHLLGLSTQRSWSTFSGGRHNLRSAAPGITFLSTFRELQGRSQPLKFFESLKRSGLMESLAEAFDAPATELEEVWLKEVRERQLPGELSVAPADVPNLVQTALIPGELKPGANLRLRLFFEDSAYNLLPDGVFIKDERTGLVRQAQAAAEEDAGYMTALIPVEENCLPGQYGYLLTAIDEAGNFRIWKGLYRVIAP